MASDEDRSTSPSNLSDARNKLKDLIPEIEGDVGKGGVQIGDQSDEILAALHPALDQMEDSIKSSGQFYQLPLSFHQLT